MSDKKPRHPLPSRKHFLRRLVRSFGLSGGFIAFSLGIGAVGYHKILGLPWLDATLNASMILTGMGPLTQYTTRADKVFGIFYTLYSGVAFLTCVAVLLGPVVSRFLHRFHLIMYGDEG